MLSSFRIQSAVGSSDGVSGYFLHFRHNMFIKIHFMVCGMVQVLFKVMIGDFVSFLKFAIILSSLLDCIVSEMCIEIFGVFGGVLAGSCSDVSVSIPVPFHATICASYCHVMSDVKLPFLI